MAPSPMLVCGYTHCEFKQVFSSLLNPGYGPHWQKLADHVRDSMMTQGIRVIFEREKDIFVLFFKKTLEA